MESYKIYYTKEAIALIESAMSYYEKEALGLDNRFQFELNKCISQIEKHPKLFSKNKENHRRAVLGSSFPYSIYYKINETEKSVEIYAVLHQSRNIDFKELQKLLGNFQNKKIKRLQELKNIQVEKEQSKNKRLER